MIVGYSIPRHVLPKLKFYNFANNFRSTPDIFTLSFVNDCFERFLLIGGCHGYTYKDGDVDIFDF